MRTNKRKPVNKKSGTKRRAGSLSSLKKRLNEEQNTRAQQKYNKYSRKVKGKSMKINSKNIRASNLNDVISLLEAYFDRELTTDERNLVVTNVSKYRYNPRFQAMFGDIDPGSFQMLNAKYDKKGKVDLQKTINFQVTDLVNQVYSENSSRDIAEFIDALSQ